jgi:hypothetical protein
VHDLLADGRRVAVAGINDRFADQLAKLAADVGGKIA